MSAGDFAPGVNVGSGILFGFRAARARPGRLLAIYCCVEIGIGLDAFAFPTIFTMIETLSIGLPIADPSLRFAADVLLTAVVIGPSAILMGATVPFLTQALPTGLSDASRLHAQI